MSLNVHQPFLDRLVPEYVRSFEAYVPNRPDLELMRLFQIDHIQRLNNNENPLGPPASAAKVMKIFPESASAYPNGDCFYLRMALAAKFNKDPEEFLVGNGSTEIITSVIKAFCERGNSIVTADRTFAVYEWVAHYSGCEAKLIPLKEFALDPDAMLDAVDENAKIVFICNPNNPTGSYWTSDVLTDFLLKLDSRSIVVIDEAYIEYVEQEDFPDGMKLMEDFPNLVVFRTFSKMYGLAALRIGFLCGPRQLIEIIRRTHTVYSVNTLAQKAAVAAIQDDKNLIQSSREMVRTAKEILADACRRLGLQYLSGEGNYMMIKVPLSDTLLYRKLLKHGILIRTMTGFRFPGWIRISMVQEDIMIQFTKILEKNLVS